MARKKDQAPASKPDRAELKKRLPAHRLVPIDKLIETSWIAVEQEKFNEIGNLLWLPEGLSDDAKNARIIKAIDLFESIKPGDGVEAMLAAQMVGTHSAAMECLRRAMVPNQTFEGRNINLTQAQRLMDLYSRQLAALDKHRGKGQQKITVERVLVEAGGQAIVGEVHTTKSAERPPSQQQEALEAPREDTVPLEAARSRAKAPR